MPAIHADPGGQAIVVSAGASIGAFNALAMLCRYPHLFGAAICMSGTYHIEQFIGGLDEDLYFSAPLHFLPGWRARSWTCCGSGVVSWPPAGAWEDIGESWRGRGPGGEGIPNRVDDWGPE